MFLPTLLASILIVKLLAFYGCTDSRSSSSGKSEEAAELASSSQGAEFFAQAFGVGLADVRWGEFHGHSSYSSDASSCGALGLADAYAYARDTAQLDFVGFSDHAEFVNLAAMPADHAAAGLDVWQSFLTTSAAYNDEDASDGDVLFVFPGWEYTNTHGVEGLHSPSGYGHKNVVFKSIDASMLPAARLGADPDKEAAGYAPAFDAPALWSGLKAYKQSGNKKQTALTVVHTPSKIAGGGSQDHRTDWNVTDAGFVRNLEIGSLWGSCEGPMPADAACVMEDPPFQWTETDPAAVPLSARSMLFERWVGQGNLSYALSFVGGSDNHFGKPGDSAQGEGKCSSPYRSMLTGVVTPTLSRDGLWNALLRKRTLASSTLRRVPVLLGVTTSSGNFFMGEVATYEGEIAVHVVADASLAVKIQLVVDGCLVQTVTGAQVDTKLSLTAGRHYLYARAISYTNKEESRAYTSPIYLKP